MKKVVHLANYDRGITIFLMPQLKALQQKGFEVHAIFPFGDQVEKIKAEGIIPHHLSISRDISFLGDLRMFFNLLRILLREKFFMVHAHTAKLEFFGQLAAFIARVPKIVYTNHGVIFRSQMGSLKKSALKVMARIAGRTSDLILSQSREDIEFLIDQGIYNRKKMAYLGNGIDISRFSPSNFTANFIKDKKIELGVPEEKMVIGMVGRFVFEKGYKEFIEAAEILLKTGIRAHFLCIGNYTGNERDPVDFQKIIPKEYDSSFLILNSRDDMDELYAIMDIMVLPSYREGFPRALMEGAAAGKPLMATNISGCREVVEHGLNGFLFEPGNSHELADGLSKLVKNEAKRVEMGNAGRSKAVKEFDQQLVVRRMLEGLEKIGVHV